MPEKSDNSIWWLAGIALVVWAFTRSTVGEYPHVQTAGDVDSTPSARAGRGLPTYEGGPTYVNPGKGDEGAAGNQTAQLYYDDYSPADPLDTSNRPISYPPTWRPRM